MSNIISRHTLVHALSASTIDHGPISDTYMGRHSVEQDPCLSIVFVGKRIQRDLCRFFAELGMAAEANHLNADTVIRLADAVCTDDLGLDMIVYFPGWKLTN